MCPSSSVTPFQLAPQLTILVHAFLQTLLQPTSLALVPVGLVHWAHPCPHLAPKAEGKPQVSLSFSGAGLWALDISFLNSPPHRRDP